MRKRVIVIGGGVGGLCSAVRLACRGYQVQLFEKNNELGGKMGRVQMDGFTFDTGPTLMTMPFVWNEFMRETETPEPDRPDLIPVEPVCRYFFHDRDPFDASSDPAVMQQNISETFPDEAGNYIRFMDYAERIYRNTAAAFIFSPIHEPRHVLQWRNLPLLMRLHQIDPFRTVHQSVKRFFTDPALIQLFDRYPTYNGSDPYRAPATLNVIPYVELGLGGYTVRGGLYSLIRTMESAARRCQVHIHTGAQVDRILHDGHRVTGIESGGERFSADVVLCNSDVVVTYNTLIQDFPKATRSLNRLEPSLSGLVFFWGIRGTFPRLKPHNILFSDNYQQEFSQIFQEQIPPEDPTIYISVSSKTESAHARTGCENWFVLVNMPYLKPGETWRPEQTDQIRGRVIGKLKSHGLDVESRIRCEQVMTPQDIEEKLLSNRGSIYGISSNTMQSAFRRPPNRSRHLQGLYFAGGSTHPGGGVPMCMLSGKIAADLIREHEGNA